MLKTTCNIGVKILNGNVHLFHRPPNSHMTTTVSTVVPATSVTKAPAEDLH